MSLIISIIAIVLSSIGIFFVGASFAEKSSSIGDHLNLPRDVKGATFDAISGSLPELLVALYSVVFFKKFEVGIGTIAGSALFNLLVIPGICILVAPVAFKVSKKVIHRDAMFYLISVFTLIVILMYFKNWGITIAVIMIAIYLIYLKDIAAHTHIHMKENEAKKAKNLKKDIFVAVLGLILIGALTFILTDHSIELSEILGISPIIVSFTVTAAATSVPDTVISVLNAKKGDIDDAASNVFGSNVFDILIGIGLPLFIYTTFNGSILIEFRYLEIVLGLLGSTIIVLYLFAEHRTLHKKHAYFLLLTYIAFVCYTVYLAL